VFYDKFVSLCKEKGVAPTRAALDIGLSKSAPIKWRTTGATPNGETLNKIENFFSVCVSFFWGKKKKKAPTPKGEREMDDLTNEILNELEGMSHAEILLVKERIQKIKESRE